MAVLAMPETLALALSADMQTMDMQPFRIMAISTGLLTVTHPRMVTTGAPDTAIGTAIVTAATTVAITATVTMIIMVVITDHQGAKNRADQRRPFLLKYCKTTQFFKVC
jgi:hypothetical protein